MIVKCPNNVILEVPENSKMVFCPETCPKRERCNKQSFIAVKAKGKPQVVVSQNIAPKLETRQEVKVEVKEELKQEVKVEVKEEIKQEVKTTESNLSRTSNVRDRFSGLLGKSNNISQVKKDNGNLNDEFVELEESKKVIIYVGSKNYYAPKFAKKYGFPNTELALLDIFKHWNTDAVFKNKDNFTDSFTNVLKLKYKSDYKKIISDVLSDDSNINAKFYRLYYNHIYKGTTISEKFYFATEYQDREIRPMIIDENDLYRHIYDRNDYLRNFIKCEKELLTYLGISTYRELLNRAIKYIYKNYGKIGHFKTSFDKNNCQYKEYVIISPTITQFVNELCIIDSIDKLESKLEFLKNYEILEDLEIVNRENDFIIPEITYDVDDGVYDVLGISEYNSSQCKNVFKLYMALLKEYIQITSPQVMHFNEISLSVSNFYHELEEIIHNAYAKCTSEAVSHNDIKILFFIYTLKESGILSYFTKQCTTSKINTLLNLVSNDIKYVNYFNSDLDTKKLLYDGKVVSVSEYFEGIIDYSELTQIANIILNDGIFKLLKDTIKIKDNIIDKRINEMVKKI